MTTLQFMQQLTPATSPLSQVPPEAPGEVPEMQGAPAWGAVEQALARVEHMFGLASVERRHLELDSLEPTPAARRTQGG